MTSSPSYPEAAKRVLLAAGTETYDSGEFARLEQVPASLRTVVKALAKLGFAMVISAPGYLLDPKTEQLKDEVNRARDAGAPVIVVYYTGHGECLEGSSYYVLTHESTHRSPLGLERSALPATDFIKLLTRRDEHGGLHADQAAVLVMLDCRLAGRRCCSTRFAESVTSGLG